MKHRIKELEIAIDRITNEIGQLESELETKRAMLLSIRGGISELKIQIKRQEEE